MGMAGAIELIHFCQRAGSDNCFIQSAAMAPGSKAAAGADVCGASLAGWFIMVPMLSMRPCCMALDCQCPDAARVLAEGNLCGLMTFLVYCILPLSVLFYITGSKRRRERKRLAASAPATRDDPA